MYWKATEVLTIDCVYKQSKNYHPQIYIEERKYTEAESQQFIVLSNSNDDKYFEV